eukprot:970395-Karenia_brevis.AAC.1
MKDFSSQGSVTTQCRRLPSYDAIATAGHASPVLEDPISHKSHEGERYLVNNTLLQSDTAGLGYRRTMTLSDMTDDDPCADWGSFVYGSRIGDDWLKVGTHYLPMMIQGKPVLFPCRR